MPPTDGAVRYRGQPVAHANGARRPIQMIFQDPFASLNPRMRVADIIGEAPRVHGLVDAEQVEDYVAQLLKRVGLDPGYVRRYPHQFSGGQRARIGIARALAVKPEFLVCDEAVAALDVSIQAQVLNLFMDLRDQFQLTYLFISHDLGVVRHLSDRVVVMYLGRVVEIASTEALFASAESSLHAGAAGRSAAHRSPAAHVRSDQGRDPVAAGTAAGLPLSSALSVRDAALLDGSAGAARDRTGTLVGVPLERFTYRFVAMTDTAFRLHGPSDPKVALVLDSPHSGFHFPSDFDAVVSEFDLRDGEDCFVDELYLPATELGVPLLAAQTPRTYLDPNRHAGDIDLDLIEGGRWPHTHVPSGKARIGKALIWRTLDDGRAIYRRKLSIDEVVGRIERCHAPISPRVARRARSHVCGFRHRLSHQLSLDEFGCRQDG